MATSGFTNPTNAEAVLPFHFRVAMLSTMGLTLRPYIIPLTALAVLLLFLAPAVRSQPDEKPAPKAAAPEVKVAPAVELPLTRVVLFNAGIGYFHREGEVTGDARLDLRFDESDVNDLLKSLILTDAAGGKPRAITYDNRLPVEFALRGFAVDVTENPSMGQLLHQVRGEKIEVTDKSGGIVTGLIASVERQPAGPAAATDPGEKINLLTEDGLQTVELKQLKKLKFVRQELQTEFKKALELLASSRGDNKKTVSVVFGGVGKRHVAVGYVREAPLWKASYRMTVDAKGALKLQGYASVENTTDEDWNNVKVGLVAGRPMTFQMDMYDPLFVPRPMVEPELFASLRPPMYQGGLNPGMGMGMGAAINPNGNGQAGGNQGFGGGGFQGGFGGIQGGFGGQFGGQYGLQGGNLTGYLPRVARPDVRTLYGQRLSFEDYLDRKRGNPTAARDPNAPADPPKPVVRDPLDKKAGALAAAEGGLGEMFEYKIEGPVTLPRQKSALLPILSETIEGSRVSIYNGSVLDKHPLLGLQLKNKTSLHLTQGPVAVYDNDTFAGDARLPDIKPGETRLVSYAIDLGTEVVVRQGETKATLLSISHVSDKNVTLRSTLRRTTTYVVRNRNPQDRTVLLEHPVSTRWKLVAPVKPDDQTRSFYRFSVPVKSDSLETFDVTEESSGSEAFAVAAAHEGLLDSEVMVRKETEKVTRNTVTVAAGQIKADLKVRDATKYTVRNRETRDRKVTIEHPVTKGLKLVAPAKPAVQTSTFYQFELALKAGEVATLEVVEESARKESHGLDASPDDLRAYLKWEESSRPFAAFSRSCWNCTRRSNWCSRG